MILECPYCGEIGSLRMALNVLGGYTMACEECLKPSEEDKKWDGVPTYEDE